MRRSEERRFVPVRGTANTLGSRAYIEGRYESFSAGTDRRLRTAAPPFRGLRAAARQRRAPADRLARQASAAACQDPGDPRQPLPRGRQPRGDPPARLGRFLRRFRRQSELLYQGDPPGARRLGNLAELHRNRPPPWLSLPEVRDRDGGYRRTASPIGAYCGSP